MPSRHRDSTWGILQHLASLGVYEPIWTTAIQEEGIRNLLEARPDINRAAAIKGKAQVIVTANLKDFPPADLIPYAIRAEHPDIFVSRCIDRDTSRAIKALENQVKALKKPPLPVEKVLENLKANGLITSVAKLKLRK